MTSLNIGCGQDPWGDVRVDMAFTFITWQIKPTLLADASYLPFKDGCFEIVKASHILEHLKNPFSAIDEMRRVGTKKIMLVFPTRRDVFPWIYSHIFPVPTFSVLKFAYLTRKRQLHLWIINPNVIMKYFTQKNWNVSFEEGTYSLLEILESRMKSKIVLFLTSKIRITVEYAITANR